MKAPKKNRASENKAAEKNSLLLNELRMLRALVNEQKSVYGPKVEYVFSRIDFANKLN